MPLQDSDVKDVKTIPQLVAMVRQQSKKQKNIDPYSNTVTIFSFF